MARDAKRRCSAKSKRSGKRCKAWAIKGGTVCVTHGGAAGQVRAKANERLQTQRAERALVLLGRPREVDPHAALLEEVYRTSGYVEMLALVLDELKREDWIGGTTRTVEHPNGGKTITVEAAYSVWYRMLVGERKHLLHACRTAVACGVERKRVELEERQGALIAQVFRAVFDDPDVGLEAPQRRRAVEATAKHLRLVASPEAA